MMKTTPYRQAEPPLLEKHILIHKLKSDIYWFLIDFIRIRKTCPSAHALHFQRS